MQSDATARNPADQAPPRQPRIATFKKVFDARKRRIRGLWRRNERFYAQITVADPLTGKKMVRRVP